MFRVFAIGVLLLMALTIVLAPLAYKMWKRFKANHRSAIDVMNEALKLAEASRPVMAFPLMVNCVCFEL